MFSLISASKTRFGGYHGKLESEQSINPKGKVQTKIVHYVKGKPIITFDRVILGGHEPSHLFSPAILEALKIPVGKLASLWNENAVSSLPAGTRVYPKGSYSYRTIGPENRRNFILYNYLYLALKHLAKDTRFHDPEKNSVSKGEQALWRKELRRILPGYVKTTSNLQDDSIRKQRRILPGYIKITGNLRDASIRKPRRILPGYVKITNILHDTSQQLNRLGAIIEHSHPWLLSAADTVVNGPKNRDGILEDAQGHLEWELNPRQIRSKTVDVDDVTQAVIEATRNARTAGSGLKVQDIYMHMKQRPTLPAAGVERELMKESFLRGPENTLNPSQVSRPSILHYLIKKLDPKATIKPFSKFSIEYAVSNELYDPLRKEPEVQAIVKHVQKLHKKLPPWIKGIGQYNLGK